MWRCLATMQHIVLAVVKQCAVGAILRQTTVFVEGEFCLQDGRPRNVSVNRWKVTTPASNVGALIVIGGGTALIFG